MSSGRQTGLSQSNSMWLQPVRHLDQRRTLPGAGVRDPHTVMARAEADLLFRGGHRLRFRAKPQMVTLVSALSIRKPAAIAPPAASRPADRAAGDNPRAPRKTEHRVDPRDDFVTDADDPLDRSGAAANASPSHAIGRRNFDHPRRRDTMRGLEESPHAPARDCPLPRPRACPSRPSPACLGHAGSARHFRARGRLDRSLPWRVPSSCRATAQARDRCARPARE